MSIFDYIFPKRCVICKKTGSYLCPQCFTHLSFDAKNLCLICNRPTYNNLTHPVCRTKYSIDGCFAALPYNKTVQKLIFNFKYKPYLIDLKNVLVDLFYESLIQNEYFERLIADGIWLMVPIPLSSSKLRKRGYNQAEILAKELAKKFNFPVQNLLTRIKDTKTQVGLSNEKRKLNIKGAFQLVTSHQQLAIRNVFLVDDVATTGSTLKEAANVLKRNGAKRVIGLTLARD
jgi:competence protein ComFC